MPTNRVRTSVSLTVEEEGQLRALAARYRTTSGMIARAMIGHCLERIDDLEVLATIEHEVAQESARRAEVGRAAMAARWGKGSDA